tara:strand:+ start:761 stop:1318 length:558 start_codon:yes stop_codon:yes gene_type:complete
MIVTISGTAGSGKSTVGKLLAKKLEVKHYSIGDFMRQIAKERNLSLEDLGKIAEGDKSIDTTLDNKQIQLGKTADEFVIDARLGYHFIPKSKKIFLTADLKSRAERIWKDITIKNTRKEERGENLKDIIEELKRREESEKKRYQQYYQTNPYDKKNYDLVVDSSSISAEAVAEKIISWLKKEKFI